MASPLSGRIVGRRGPRVPLAIAGVAMTAGCLLLTATGPATPLAHLLAAYVVFGIGLGFVNAPITNAAVSGMPRAQAGVAAGIASTSRQVGSALGVAVTGAVLAAGLHGPLPARSPAMQPGGCSPAAGRSCWCSASPRPPHARASRPAGPRRR